MNKPEIEARLSQLSATDVWKEDIWATADTPYPYEDEDGVGISIFTEADLIKKELTFRRGSDPNRPKAGFRYDPQSKTLYLSMNLSDFGRQMAAPLRRELLY
jgi:hypothetical protein